MTRLVTYLLAWGTDVTLKDWVEKSLRVQRFKVALGSSMIVFFIGHQDGKDAKALARERNYDDVMSLLISGDQSPLTEGTPQRRGSQVEMSFKGKLSSVPSSARSSRSARTQ